MEVNWNVWWSLQWIGGKNDLNPLFHHWSYFNLFNSGCSKLHKLCGTLKGQEIWFFDQWHLEWYDGRHAQPRIWYGFVLVHYTGMYMIKQIFLSIFLCSCCWNDNDNSKSRISLLHATTDNNEPTDFHSKPQGDLQLQCIHLNIHSFILGICSIVLYHGTNFHVLCYSVSIKFKYSLWYIGWIKMFYLVLVKKRIIIMNTLGGNQWYWL